jgi:hypothetical protein
MMDGYRRIPLVFFCLLLAMSGALSAQQAPPALVADLMKANGTLRGEGQNTKANGPLGLKSYRVHELGLAQPITVTIGGKPVTTSKAWRLTITGGPFAVRAIPASIEIDGAAAGVALESADRSELRLVTFDPAALHQGAQVAVAYGEMRFNLPETLNLNR